MLLAVCSTCEALLMASEAVFVFCVTVELRPVTVCCKEVRLLTVTWPSEATPSMRVDNSSSFVVCPLTVVVTSLICPASRSPLSLAA